MVKSEMSVDIDRPIEEVFAYLAHPTEAPQWMSGIVECTVEGGGPIHVGSRIKGVMKMLRKFDFTAEVTKYEPPYTLAIRGVFGPGGKGRDEKRLESIGRGTRVHYSAELETSGLFKLAAPLLGTLLNRTAETDLQALKALVEANPLGKKGSPVVG